MLLQRSQTDDRSSEMRKRFCFKRQKRFLQFGILEVILMYFPYKSNTV